jgi:hypothetical protein
MDKEFSPECLQKATLYEESKHKKLLPGRWIQKKIDGNGAQVLCNGDITIHAMQPAKVSGMFTDWTLKVPHIIKELEVLQNYGINGWEEPFQGVIQGELYVDYFEPGNPNFGFVTGTLRAEDALERQGLVGNRGIWYPIKFVAYEMPSSQLKYKDRYEHLKNMFENCAKKGITFKYISLNPIMGLVSKSCEEVEICFNEIVSEGGEGLVLYDPNCYYKHDKNNKHCQRNVGLIKMKSENEREVLVVEMHEGDVTEKGGKFVGSLGSVTCIDGEGRKFNIGSFSIDNTERQWIWDNLRDKLPFICEMTYFEKTDTANKDSIGSYKLARYIRTRLDKRIEDWNMVD